MDWHFHDAKSYNMRAPGPLAPRGAHPFAAAFDHRGAGSVAAARARG